MSVNLTFAVRDPKRLPHTARFMQQYIGKEPELVAKLRSKHGMETNGIACAPRRPTPREQEMLQTTVQQQFTEKVVLVLL